MALINYSGLVTSINGSIGGLSFQRTLAGNIVRLRPTGIKKQSSAQNLISVDYLLIEKFWLTLPLSYKQIWADYAALYQKTTKWGTLKTISGFAYFMSYNYYCYLFTGSFISEPTAPPVFESVPAFELLFLAGEITVGFDTTYDHSDYYLLIFATPPIYSPGLRYRNQLRLITIVSPSISNFIEITDDYCSVFGITWPPAGASDSLYSICAIQAIHYSIFSAGMFTLFNAQYSAV